jgi:hypothetical protein
MTKDTVHTILTSLLISAAIYPVVFLGVWALFALGSLATDMHLPSDIMPLAYGLIFAVLTVALIDILGVASVVMALVASANLIEYAQLVIPGRSASLVDFMASLAGVIFAAVLVWMARALVARHHAQQQAGSAETA